MSRHFTATVLLERPSDLDVDLIAELAQERFPGLDLVEGVPGQAGSASGVIQVERCQAIMQLVPHRIHPRLIEAPSELLQNWDPDPALKSHRAHLNISCGGRRPGVEGAEEYASAAHLIAAAACEVMEGKAVLWQNSFGVHAPEAISDAATTIMSGQMPLSSWVSFAPVVPDGVQTGAAMGMMTFGLRHFLGRELELAPYPDDVESVYRCLSSVVRMVLDRGLTLHDGLTLKDSTGEISMTVRERIYRLRRDRSAFVLVPDNALVDKETLKLRQPLDWPVPKAS